MNAVISSRRNESRRAIRSRIRSPLVDMVVSPNGLMFDGRGDADTTVNRKTSMPQPRSAPAAGYATAARTLRPRRDPCVFAPRIDDVAQVFHLCWRGANDVVLVDRPRVGI